MAIAGLRLTEKRHECSLWIGLIVTVSGMSIKVLLMLGYLSFGSFDLIIKVAIGFLGKVTAGLDREQEITTN